MTDKVSIDLSGPSQTMLTTLYCKALDADCERPILGDDYAKAAVARIDYDWSELKVTNRWTPLVTVRTAQFDVWAGQFLAANPNATVIHVGCGLDSRVFRLNPGPDVQWYDVDYPAVISLREKIFPSRPNYHLVATPATDPSWLDEIPADRPTLLLAEGISMYLTEDDGIELLQHVIDRFGTGEIQIDYYSRLVVRSQKTHRLQRQSGSTLYWAVEQTVRRSRSAVRRPIGRRGDVFRRQHVRPRVGSVPVDAALGPGPAAAAPNLPVPPLRLRPGQLTARALLGDLDEQRTDGLDRLLRLRPVRVVFDVELLGVDLGEVDLDAGADLEVELAVRRGHLHTGVACAPAAPNRCRTTTQRRACPARCRRTAG